MYKLKTGLDGTSLKLIALFLMTLDHIHAFLGGVVDVPLWFTMLGRSVAPIFIFMVTIGMRYTRDRVAYMKRLYIGGIVMSLCNYFISLYFPHPAGTILTANIFGTMFLITLYIYGGQKIREAMKRSQFVTVLTWFVLLLLPLISGFFYIYLAPLIPMNMLWLLPLLNALLPSVLLTEGGFLFIILGIGFYLCGESKPKQAVFYTLYCLFIFVVGGGLSFDLQSLFESNIQWMMILSLPLLMLYNGEKGKGLKHLFYIYYPLHIYIIYFLAILLGNR